MRLKNISELLEHYHVTGLNASDNLYMYEIVIL